MTPAPISRRRAIILGGLGAASLATGATGWIATTAGGGTGSRMQPRRHRRRTGPAAGPGQPGRRLQVELTAAAGVRLAGRDLFDGTSPGPTLRVRPGDELAVRLTRAPTFRLSRTGCC